MGELTLRVLAVAVCVSGAMEAALYGGVPDTASVVRVTDVGTLLLDSGAEVRLLGVMLPDTSDPAKAARYDRLLRDAAAFIRRLAEGKRVRLASEQGRLADSGELVAYVYLEDDLFVNAEVVKHGHGFAASHRFKFRDGFRELQRDARRRGVGVWGMVCGSPMQTRTRSRSRTYRRERPAGTQERRADVPVDAGQRYHRRGSATRDTPITDAMGSNLHDRGLRACPVCGADFAASGTPPNYRILPALGEVEASFDPLREYLRRLAIIQARDNRLNEAIGELAGGSLLPWAETLDGMQDIDQFFGQYGKVMQSYGRMTAAKQALGNDFLRACEPIARICPPVQNLHRWYVHYFEEWIRATRTLEGALRQHDLGMAMQLQGMLQRAENTERQAQREEDRVRDRYDIPPDPSGPR